MTEKGEASASSPQENEWTLFMRGIPKIPEHHVEQWGQVSTAGILAGMMYGGAREATATHASFMDTFRTSHTRFTQRELMEKRLIQIVRGTVRGGIQLGLIAGIFSATQITIAAVARGGEQDKWCTAGAATATGAAMGLVGRGGAMTRLQASMSLALTGAAIGFPLGLVQDYLRALIPEPKLPSADSVRQVEASQEVADAIERLESRLLRDSKDSKTVSREDQ